MERQQYLRGLEKSIEDDQDRSTAALGTVPRRRRRSLVEDDPVPVAKESVKAMAPSTAPVTNAQPLTYPPFLISHVTTEEGATGRVPSNPSPNLINLRSNSTIGSIQLQFSLWNPDIELLTANSEHTDAVSHALENFLCLDTTLKLVELAEEQGDEAAESGGGEDSSIFTYGAVKYRSVCHHNNNNNKVRKKNRLLHVDEELSIDESDVSRDLQLNSGGANDEEENGQFALILRGTPSYVQVANEYVEPFFFSSWTLVYPVWDIGPTFLNFVSGSNNQGKVGSSTASAAGGTSHTEPNGIMTAALKNINVQTQLGVDVQIQYGMMDEKLQLSMPGFYASVSGREGMTYSRIVIAEPGDGSHSAPKFEPESAILQYFGISLFIIHTICLVVVTWMGTKRRNHKKHLEKHSPRLHHHHHHRHNHDDRVARGCLHSQEGLEQILSIPPQHLHSSSQKTSMDGTSSPTTASPTRNDPSGDSPRSSSSSAMYTASEGPKMPGVDSSDSESDHGGSCDEEGSIPKTYDGPTMESRLMELDFFADCIMPAPSEDIVDDDDKNNDEIATSAAPSEDSVDDDDNNDDEIAKSAAPSEDIVDDDDNNRDETATSAAPSEDIVDDDDNNRNEIATPAAPSEDIVDDDDEIATSAAPSEDIVEIATSSRDWGDLVSEDEVTV